jgi:hypothetical protein
MEVNLKWEALRKKIGWKHAGKNIGAQLGIISLPPANNANSNEACQNS